MFFFAPIEAWAPGYLEGEDAGFAIGGLWVAGNVFAPATITYQYGYPISDIATNSWSPSTGGTLYGVLDEVTADDADYIYSPDNPTTQQFEVRLTSLGDPVSSTDHTVTVRLQAMTYDTTFDLNLVQNTTILDSWSEAVTVAAGVVERSRTLSGAVADSITDYTNLRVRGVARAP